MHLPLCRVFLPGGEVGFDLQHPQPVQRHRVEGVGRAIVLLWIARAHDHPALRQRILAEALVLQQLQHRRGQRLGHAVDLVQKQNARCAAADLHVAVHPGQQLGHGVLRDRTLLAAEAPRANLRKAQRALAGVVGHGVAHQPHAQPPRDLRHHVGLAHAGRADQEQRPLGLGRNQRHAIFIPRRVAAHRRLQLMGRLLYIHAYASVSIHSIRRPLALARRSPAAAPSPARRCRRSGASGRRRSPRTPAV